MYLCFPPALRHSLHSVFNYSLSGFSHMPAGRPLIFCSVHPPPHPRPWAVLWLGTRSLLMKLWLVTVSDHNQGSRLCTFQSALTGETLNQGFGPILPSPFGSIAASSDWLIWTQKRIQPCHTVSGLHWAVTTVSGTCWRSSPLCPPLLPPATPCYPLPPPASR